MFSCSNIITSTYCTNSLLKCFLIRNKILKIPFSAQRTLKKKSQNPRDYYQQYLSSFTGEIHLLFLDLSICKYFWRKTLCEREERIFESSHLLIFQLSACVSIYDVIGPSGEIREPLSHRTLGVRQCLIESLPITYQRLRTQATAVKRRIALLLPNTQC